MSCFYEQGLRFTCQDSCYYCCGVEPGFVFLTKSDLRRLSEFLSLSKEDVIRAYCRKVPFGSFSYISLNEKKNHDCIFLHDQKKCSVYQGRPTQCKTYPFWSTIVDSQESWSREKEYCPGINVGQLHTKEDIDAYLEMRQNEAPALWEEYFS
ncbi:MAG: YkgJ family cysteine cluster protein [Sphaerochaetaceae bacterium]